MAMFKKSSSVLLLHPVFILVVIVTPHACHGHSHSGHTSSENPELKLINLDRESHVISGLLFRSRRDAKADVEDLEGTLDHSGESDPDQLRLDKPAISLGSDQEGVNRTDKDREDFRFEETSLEAGVSLKSKYESELVKRESLNGTQNVISENTTEPRSGLDRNNSTTLSDNLKEHEESSHQNYSSHSEESTHSHDNHGNHHDDHEHSESEPSTKEHNSSESHDNPEQVNGLPRTIPAVSKEIIKKLFLKYGDGQSMNFEGFEHMLENIGLGNIEIDDHEVEDHFQGDGSFVDLHEGHDHSEVPGADHVHGEDVASDIEEPTPNPNRRKNKKRNRQKGNKKPRNRKTSRDSGGLVESRDMEESESFQSSRRRRHAHEAENETLVEQCMPVLQLYNIYSSRGNREDTTEPAPLTPGEFLLLCPLLIYQLDAHSCHHSNQKPCQLDEAALDEHCKKYHHSDHDHHNETSPKYQSRYHGYEDDEHHHGDDDHSHHMDDDDDVDDYATDISSSSSSNENAYASINVWGYALLSCIIISLVGLASVAVVPIMHKVIYNHLLQFLVALAIGSLTGDAFLHLLPHSIKPHNHSSSSVDNSHGSHAHHHHGDDSNEYVPDDEIEMDKTAIWIGLVALSGVYFFFLMERIMAIVTRKRRDKNREKRKRNTANRRFSDEGDTQIGAKLSGHRDMTKSCEEVLMVVHPNKDVKDMAVEAHNEVHQNCDPGVRNSWAPGHSHGGAGGHHHSHQVPGSVSSVAWMVIMGDGLHNFSDGLAIGAAFASSLTSGLSTSIAVFCHELPHELGDFAVLLRAGMSVKQALVYNCVSSVLCLLGMVIGIVVGNFTSASTWIFAIIAGMFIYIALVDMLPELTSVAPKDGENPCVHLLLQSLGILTGAAIMLVIAVYEDRIRIPDLDT